MTQTDIIKSIIGALIGFSLPHIFRAITYLFRRLKKTRIEGKWYVYHPTLKSGQMVIENATWYIGKGITSLFSIKEERQTIKNFAKGEINIERNYLLVKLKATEHDEEVSLRIFNPISTMDDILWGMYLSLDFQGNPIAGAIIISRKEMSDDDVLGFISKKFKVENKMKLLTV